MTWGLGIFAILAMLVGGGLVVAGALVGKVVRGEPIELGTKPPPKPTIRTAKQEAELWSKLQREAEEKGYGQIPMETLPPR